MRNHRILLGVLIAIIAILALANWAALSQPIDMNLLFGHVVAPVGALAIVCIAAVLLLDWTIYAMRRRTWTAERRDLSLQLEQSRQLADSAEESRIRGLRETMEREFAAIRAQLDQALTSTSANRVTFVRDTEQPRVYEKNH